MNDLYAAGIGAMTALLVAVAIACTSMPSPDAGGCAAPSSGQAGCVLPILARNVSSWNAGLSQATHTCGVSEDNARALWDSHVQAEVLEGFVPRAIGDGGIKP